MPYNCAADTEIGRFAFLRPLLGDLEETYDDHLRLIGKRVVDFPLVLIELFFVRCYGWGATGEYRLKNGDFAPTGGAVGPKFQAEGVALTNHSSSQKTRLNGLSYDIKMWTDLSSILSQIARLSDRRTDGQTEFSSLDRVCIACSAVKTDLRLKDGIRDAPITVKLPTHIENDKRPDYTTDKMLSYRKETALQGAL